MILVVEDHLFNVNHLLLIMLEYRIIYYIYSNYFDEMFDENRNLDSLSSEYIEDYNRFKDSVTQRKVEETVRMINELLNLYYKMITRILK